MASFDVFVVCAHFCVQGEDFYLLVFFLLTSTLFYSMHAARVHVFYFATGAYCLLQDA